MNCTKREIHCHSKCKKYKEFKEKVGKAQEKAKKEFEYKCYLADLLNKR